MNLEEELPKRPDAAGPDFETPGEATANAVADAPVTREAEPPLPIDWSTEPVPAYANGVHVTHTPVDFAVVFTDMNRMPGRHAPDNQSGHERAMVTASLRMTPDIYFQALCVLASNWNRFATQFIDPRMRRPRFKLLDSGELQLEGVPSRGVDD